MKGISATALVALLLVSRSAISAPAEDESWSDRITLKGDLRLRFEAIDEDGEVSRDRMRFRTRFGLSAAVSDDLKVVIRLASGGDNPVSNNQTFDDGFSGKDIAIDLAYIDWKINENLIFYGGKMKNPLFKAGGVPLIWDSDLNPEGFALKYTPGVFFGTVGGFSVEERSSTGDSFLYAVQAGVKLPLGGNGSLTVGAGYFAYTETIGNTPFFDARAKGNTLDVLGNYVFDYKDTELFAQFDSKLGDWPLKIYAHVLQNNEVSAQDTGYAIGAKMGSAKLEGTADFSWTYQDIEADAVVGTFNGSDFGGGGTDSEGHVLKAKYAMSEMVILGGTLFVNKVDRFQGSEHDYSRLQLDVEFKFD